MMKNRKVVTVAHVVGTDAPSDLGEYLFVLGRWLGHRRFRQRYVALDGRTVGRLASWPGVGWTRAGASLGPPALAGFGLARWLADNDCDLIHAWGPGAIAAVAWACGRGPVPPVCLSIHEPRDARLSDTLLGRLQDGMPRLLVCPSEPLRDRLIQSGAPPRRCVVIRPGAAFEPQATQRGGLRLVSAGRGGHLHAMWAAALLQELYGNVSIVLRTSRGQGPREARFADALLRPEIVAFAGAEVELGDLLAGAAAAIFAPERAICPTPVAWAMAAGVPVIATRQAGLDDWVRHEQTGLIVEQPLGRLLAAAIIRLQDDPALRETIVTGARQFAQDHFDPAVTAEAFAVLYETLYKDVSLSQQHL